MMEKTQFKTEGRQLTITRDFEASLTLVWRTWTEATLLDQWWAPKPWKSKTSYMDFSEGGYRLYAMIGPEGERHLGRTDYLSIILRQSFSGEDSFCDDKGNINHELPISTFENQFEEINGRTRVTIRSEYASEEHLKQIIEMGMKEGLQMAYGNLDHLLKDLNS